MNSDNAKNKTMVALLGAVAAAAIFSAVLAPSALANPSQIQYGYDPIVDAGDSSPDQPGTPKLAPDEKVDQASAVVAGVLAGRENGSGRVASGRRQGGSTGSDLGRGKNGALPGADKIARERDTEAFSLESVWLVLIVLALSVGLIAWALVRRRQLGAPNTIDLVVRGLSIAIFIALIVILNGSSGSILG